MCLPPDIAPQLPPSATRSQSALNANQVYQPRSWVAQQEQWTSVDRSAPWDWYDIASNPQAQQLNCDSARAPPLATLGLPVNPALEESFSNNYGFLGSSASQAFGQAPNAAWNAGLKVPLQTPSLWQESSLAKWSNALNPSPKPESSKPCKLSQWTAPPNSQMESADADNSDESPATKNKKIKRMLSNRASAKRSRQRRQERLDELEIQSAKLHVEHAAMNRKLKEALDASRRYQDENSRLKREIDLLRSQLDQNNPKRLKVSSDGESEKELAPKLLTEAKSSGSGKSETCQSLPSHSTDLFFHGEVKQEEDATPQAKKTASARYDFSAFSPESGLTASPSNAEFPVEASLLDLGFPIVHPDAIDNGLGGLEEDWFADLVDCFDEKPFGS